MAVSSNEKGCALMVADVEEPVMSIQPLPDPLSAEQQDDRPPVRIMAFVFLSMFQAYAAMQNLQFVLKKDMDIGQIGHRAEMFTLAVTMLHVGKLLSRLGHNLLCACWSPLTRVLISMVFVIVGSSIAPIFVLNLGSTWLGWVFISYFLIGVGIGVFEATFLAVIAPLGRRTKSFAILGIPTGFVTIGVPGVLLLNQGMPTQVIYWYVIACAFASIAMIIRWKPSLEAATIGMQMATTTPVLNANNVKADSQLTLLSRSIKAWRLWLPLLLPHLVGKMAVNFGMENLFPVVGFTFNAAMVPLFGPGSDFLISKFSFQALQNICIFAGDSYSRRIPYYTSDKSSISVSFVVAALFSVVTSYVVLKTAIAWVFVFSISLAFFANGLVYATGSRHIDGHIAQENRLAAYSLWCFMGDISSVVGVASQDVIRAWICDGVQSNYECLTS